MTLEMPQTHWHFWQKQMAVKLPRNISLILPGAILTLVSQVFGSWIGRHILATASPGYAKPIRLLFWYLTIVAVPSALALVITWWFGEVQGTDRSALFFFSGVIPELLLLYTGYVFKKGTSQ